MKQSFKFAIRFGMEMLEFPFSAKISYTNVAKESDYAETFLCHFKEDNWKRERERAKKGVGGKQQKREPEKCAFALNFNMGDTWKNYCWG